LFRAEPGCPFFTLDTGNGGRFQLRISGRDDRNMSDITPSRAEKSQNISWTAGKITPEQRAERNGHRGCVVWFTGLSAAGKSTIAVELERELFSRGMHTCLLDGDNIRHTLCSDLGFSPADRRENIRRVGAVAGLFAGSGIICITAFISPYRSDRDLARQMASPSSFVEVYVNAPLEICERRDPKGLYAKARAGKIVEFTGVSAPYEAPLKPEVEIRTDELSIQESVGAILRHLSVEAAAFSEAQKKEAAARVQGSSQPLPVFYPA
jgi:adenylyl-sulfate kinase